ncbi:LbtU family siderophore porin [Desulfoferula mesophila]|uniref:LbtU family siderophore porin n=1 Tax=Desulfoferula mesophila TaxID=3058419 RepID=UPI0030CB546D
MISPSVNDQEEWGDIDLPPTSGSLKISRTPEGIPPLTQEEPVLKGVTWKVWGQAQLEASWQKNKDSQGDTSRDTRAYLSTAEIFGELRPVSFVRLYTHLLYEDGVSGIKLDEAFAVLGRTKDFSGYFMGGKVYPAVGAFESYMVSDAITKEVFQTQANAGVAGWDSQWWQASLAGYDPSVSANGDDGGLVSTYTLRLQMTPPAKGLGGLQLSLGGSYTNNIAASSFLEEQVPEQRLDSMVGGFSLSGSAAYGPLTLLAEYIRSGSFGPGELAFAPPGASPQPWAYNLELSWALAETWRLTGRWEGSGDLYSEYPERQAGVCLAWEPWIHLALALEYQHGEYPDGTLQDLVTSQLSLMF